MASLTRKYLSALNGKNVLVFGGSSGVGLHVAEGALEQGAHVTICSSQQAKLDSAVSHLKAQYPALAANVDSFVVDLSKLEHLSEQIEKALKFATHVAKLDHIVFTAGGSHTLKHISDFSSGEMVQPGVTRFFAPMTVASYAQQYMNIDNKSSIIFTGGTTPQKPVKNWTVQAAYGGALAAAVKGLALDLSPIRVNQVVLGAVSTAIWNGVPEEVKEKVGGMALVGRLGEPREAAEAYLFLMGCTFVTGEGTLVDGGRMLV